jgi:MYXO-CTERM domain-containing protein
MWNKLAICVPTVVVSLALTFAPVFAQDTQETYDGPRTAAAEADEDDGSDLGWLGLLGLVGLAGLIRRDRVRHTVDDKHSHR